MQIRRELVDMARHHYGPMGEGAHHHTDARVMDKMRPDQRDPEDNSGEPSSLAEWTDFHGKVDLLPDAEREVFHLLWYEGLNQEEAAKVLDVTSPPVENRWRNAKIHLQGMLDQGPETES